MNLLTRIGRGLQAGGLAGGGVAVLFLANDVVRLAPLRTVAELSGPFRDQPADAVSDGTAFAAVAAVAAAVTLYTVLHFGAFALLGVIATWIVPGRTFWTTLARGALFGGVSCTGVFLVGRAAAGTSLTVASASPVGIVLANVLAGVIMAAVLAVYSHAGEDTRGGSVVLPP